MTIYNIYKQYKFKKILDSDVINTSEYEKYHCKLSGSIYNHLYSSPKCIHSFELDAEKFKLCAKYMDVADLISQQEFNESSRFLINTISSIDDLKLLTKISKEYHRYYHEFILAVFIQKIKFVDKNNTVYINVKSVGINDVILFIKQNLDMSYLKSTNILYNKLEYLTILDYFAIKAGDLNKYGIDNHVIKDLLDQGMVFTMPEFYIKYKDFLSEDIIKKANIAEMITSNQYDFAKTILGLVDTPIEPIKIDNSIVFE